jgi:hypothetical protein
VSYGNDHEEYYVLACYIVAIILKISTDVMFAAFLALSFALEMEVVYSFETSANFYKTTKCNLPDSKVY